MPKLRQFLILSSLISQVMGISISGFIRDNSTGEPLSYTNVVILENQMGTSTDVTGYFILPKAPSGNYTLGIMMIGYKTIEKKIGVSTENIRMDFRIWEVGVPEPFLHHTGEIPFPVK